MARDDNHRARSTGEGPEATRAPGGASERHARRASRFRNALRAGSAALAATLATLAPAAAEAQQSTFYLDRLFMPGAPSDTLALWRPEMDKQTRLFGQLGLGFALNPFRIENHIDDPAQAARFAQQGGGAPVRAQLITYASVGAEILERVSVQAQMPVVLFQTGNPTVSQDIGGDTVSLVPVAPMDLRLDARVIVFRNPARTFKLGLQGGVWVPTGNEISMAGDRSTSGGFGLGLEYALKKFFFVVNTGVQLRPTSGVNDFKVGNEVRLGLGGFVPLRDDAVRIGAQIFGSTGITGDTFFDADNTPFEWMVEGRFALDKKKRAWFTAGGGTRLTPGYAPDFRLVTAVGYAFPLKDVNPPSPSKRFKFGRYAEHGADTDKDGLPDDIDLCPTEPEDHKPPNADDGCPSLPDRDGDGIPDNVDKCPDTPEDFDKVDDKDGCPEDDPDKDQIPDAEDACPKEPGERNEVAEKNGCPAFIRRITGSNEIQILKQVQFATGKATILPSSYPILDEVVRLLRVNPEIKHLAIEGHTDNRGSDELNQKLSDDRAHAVMNYLVEKGKIDANKLSAAGFGPQRPIADNNTADGRQKNRRVEFHIRDQAPNLEVPK
jgi:outer membrane protein OmpA-like peptidoglycan-associated protein